MHTAPPSPASARLPAMLACVSATLCGEPSTARPPQLVPAVFFSTLLVLRARLRPPQKVRAPPRDCAALPLKYEPVICRVGRDGYVGTGWVSEQVASHLQPQGII